MRAARRASHLMALVGLASLAVTGQIGTPWVAGGALAVAASVVADIARRSPSLPALWANLLILTALAFAIADALWLSPTVLHVGAHLLIVLMLTRLRHRNAREYMQLVVIVFLQMVAAAGLAAHSTLNVGFALYLPVMVWVLVHYHLLSEAERADPAPNEPPAGLAPWIAAAALTALIAAGVIFVFLPRMGLELLGVIPQQDVRLSGFSPQVRLGAIGPVKRDPTIVMRVTGKSIGPGGQPVYLRGAVFDTFDGKNWLATTPARRMVDQDGRGRFALGRLLDPTPWMAIRAEPLDTPVLFTPQLTEALAGPFSAVLVDEDEIFHLSHPPHVRQSYDIWRWPRARSLPIDATVAERYLRQADSARITELARQASASGETPLSQALAVERFLRTRYAYDLDVPGGEERPVETFLFERRSGYCEHFSSAMALMLRALGIPTRLVTGFLVQEWNPYGQYAIVRQGDAHAWVEAFLPQMGWTRFDPTPSVPGSDRPWTGPLEHYFDNFRTGWDRYVLDFSLGDQHAAIEQAEVWWARLRTTATETLGAVRQRVGSVPDMVWMLGWLLVTLAAGGTAIGRGWRWPMVRRTQPDDSSVLFYQRLLYILERKGIPRPAASTPLEFALHHTSRLDCSSEVLRVTERYYQVRYAHQRLSTAERRALESDLEVIEGEDRAS